MNRIFTEWYPSRGYTFNITNSTSYDQYYVHGRNIFEVMEKLTDDIFNTYVRRQGTIEPYYTEYCDGKSVTCKGMKQWGTVDRANEGKNALQILKYYYGNDIEIVRTNNLQGLPLLRQPGHRRGVRRGHRVHGEGLPEAVQPDGGRRGGPGHLVQDQLHLCVGEGPGGADQRGRKAHR